MQGAGRYIYSGYLLQLLSDSTPIANTDFTYVKIYYALSLHQM